MPTYQIEAGEAVGCDLGHLTGRRCRRSRVFVYVALVQAYVPCCWEARNWGGLAKATPSCTVRYSIHGCLCWLTSQVSADG